MGGRSSVIQQNQKQTQIQPNSEQKSDQKINQFKSSTKSHQNPKEQALNKSFKSPATANQNQKESPNKAKNLLITQQKNILDELLPNQISQISLNELREKISRINLPICIKGKNHSQIEFICVDHHCQPVDQLKLLCQRYLLFNYTHSFQFKFNISCIKQIMDDDIGDHVHKDVIQILLSQVNQIDSKRPQNNIFSNTNTNVGDMDISECFNNLINRIQNHIQKCEKVLQNIKASQENITKNKHDNDVIIDQQEVRSILEQISDSNTEKNLIKGFKKLKKYSIIYEDDLLFLNIHQILEKQIQEKTFIYSQTFNQRLNELGIQKNLVMNKDQIMSNLLKMDILERGDDIFLQRENQLNSIQKQIQQKHIGIDQKRLEEQKLRQSNLRRTEEERRRKEEERQQKMLLSKQESPTKKENSTSRQKQELQAERQQMVFLMENHVKQCDNLTCRSVEWGMETEYKYIGVIDNTISEGRRKTTCVKGKELNHQMKEIIRKLKLIGE